MADDGKNPDGGSGDGDGGGSEVTLESLAERLDAATALITAQDEEISKLKRRRGTAAKPTGTAAKNEPASDDGEADALKAALEQSNAQVARMQTKARRATALTAATGMRAVDPEAIATMVNFDALDDPDDDDQIKDAVKDLLKQNPARVRRDRSGAAEGGGEIQQPETDMNKIIRGAAGRG